MQNIELTVEHENIVRQLLEDINIEAEAITNFINVRTHAVDLLEDYEIEITKKEVDKTSEEFMKYLSNKARKVNEIVPNLFQFDKKGIVIIPQL